MLSTGLVILPATTLINLGCMLSAPGALSALTLSNWASTISSFSSVVDTMDYPSPSIVVNTGRLDEFSVVNTVEKYLFSSPHISSSVLV